MNVFTLYFWKSHYSRTRQHQWCISWRGRKIIVRAFYIHVPVESRSRKRNPHAVVWGRASKIAVKDKIATIS